MRPLAGLAAAGSFVSRCEYVNRKPRRLVELAAARTVRVEATFALPAQDHGGAGFGHWGERGGHAGNSSLCSVSSSSQSGGILRSRWRSNPFQREPNAVGGGKGALQTRQITSGHNTIELTTKIVPSLPVRVPQHGIPRATTTKSPTLIGSLISPPSPPRAGRCSCDCLLT